MKVPLIGVVLVVLACPLAAQVRYKDDEGVINWVDSMDQVPPKYRSGAVDTSPKVAPPSEKDGKPASDEAKQEKAAEQAKPRRYSVTYAVEGETPIASVTFLNDKGASQREMVKIPWKRVFEMEKGAPLSISAQNQSGRGGGVTVRILVEGKVLARSDSDGPFVTASTTTTCC